MGLKPIVLILGAGGRIGTATTTLFADAGFLVAAVSRSREDGLTSEGHLNIKADLTDTRCLSGVFDRVQKAWGPPSVVIYNGYSRNLADPSDPLAAFSLPQLQGDISMNVTNAVQAAHLAVQGFKELPPSHFKTFIYTGNKLNVMPSPFAPVFGLCKTAMAQLMWSLSVGYHEVGYKFYYTDERYPDGRPVLETWSGEARADICLKLVEGPEQRAWNHTFVKNHGYVDFRGVDGRKMLENSYGLTLGSFGATRADRG